MTIQRMRATIDWVLVGALIPILAAGLVTMNSFTDGSVMARQAIWIAIALIVFFVFSYVDMRFLKSTKVLVSLFFVGVGLLLVLFILGSTIKGATSWINFGAFSFQPADFMKVILILMLAKYFSRRHIHIRDVKHIFVSGFYMFLPFLLVFFQPDFGSAVILFLIWFGMVLVAGISKKHLFGMLGIGVLSLVLLWSFALAPYQKARVMSFLHPLEDVRGSGYNAYQSTVAVGSGQWFGKGVGYGTQSRLSFLPEYETDFIFAAYAEEWGFIGGLILLILYSIVIWRILQTAIRGAGNFEILFGIGVAIYLTGHLVINVGMNIGVLPVTGIPLPFMSQGGSHLLAEFIALGILMSFRKHQRTTHKDDLSNEFVGI